jgi:hypothetical protein
MRSPGYVKVIEWLSEIWRNFDENILINSFDKCGITSQNNLHSALKAIVEEGRSLLDYVDDFHAADEIYGFNDDDLFGEVENDNDDEIACARKSRIAVIIAFVGAIIITTIIKFIITTNANKLN